MTKLEKLQKNVVDTYDTALYTCAASYAFDAAHTLVAYAKAKDELEDYLKEQDNG